MGTESWLDQIGPFPVERREIPRPGNKPYIPNLAPDIGMLHTTEGRTVDSAFNTLSQKRIAPTFIIGEDRIIQCRPLNAQASALHEPANKSARVQIEMVGFSKQTLWLPERATLEPTIAVLAYCAQELSIPLIVPNDWPDDVSDMKGQIWATNNRRRKLAAAGDWPKKLGWWMHLEVPLQGPSWHWDCGALRRTEMLSMAAHLIGSEHTKKLLGDE